jgi:DNA-binding transcriptional ArsR family regulator
LAGEDTQIPVEVRELILDRLKSIEELEVLLLIRTDAPRAWTTEQLASTLKLPAASVEAALSALSANRLVTAQPDGTHQYDAADAKTRLSVEMLAQVYAGSRVEILVFIATNAINRVRKGALQTFSEAFRLKGRKDDG